MFDLTTDREKIFAEQASVARYAEDANNLPGWRMQATDGFKSLRVQVLVTLAKCGPEYHIFYQGMMTKFSHKERKAIKELIIDEGFDVLAVIAQNVQGFEYGAIVDSLRALDFGRDD